MDENILTPYEIGIVKEALDILDDISIGFTQDIILIKRKLEPDNPFTPTIFEEVTKV